MPAPLNVIGIDYSFSPPDYNAFVKAGIKYVCRYLSHTTAKNIDRAEFKELDRRGIRVVLVWESTGGRAFQGYAAGLGDARAAASQAEVVTGHKDAPIYFAVDRDVVTQGQFAQVHAYMRGVQHILGRERTGVYCEYDMIDYLVKRGVCKWFWQPAAWSGNKVHRAAHIYQRHNGIRVGTTEADLDVAFAGGYGAVGGPGPVPPHPPMPPGPSHPDSKLKIWREHLRLALKVRKLVGTDKELSLYIARLKRLIRGGK